MQLTFTSSDGEQSGINLFQSRKFELQNGCASKEFNVDANWGNMLLKEVCFEDVCLLYSQGTFAQKCEVKLRSKRFCCLASFILDGEVRVNSTSGDDKIRLLKNRYYTFCTPKLNAEISMERSVGVFTVGLTHSFIRRFLNDGPLNDLFKTNPEESSALILSGELENNRLKLLVTEMMQASQPDYIQQLFLQGKILEILSLQLENLEHSQADYPVFNHADTKRLHQAKAIVLENLQTPCSLIELARKTGLNDFKLKKGFKTLFGHTVFGYLAEVRMEKACALLQDGQSVNEVSELVGYKNAHHFSAAFKKKYKVLPSRMSKF